MWQCTLAVKPILTSSTKKKNRTQAPTSPYCVVDLQRERYATLKVSEICMFPPSIYLMLLVKRILEFKTQRSKISAMPDVSVGSQIFDIAFHPTHCTAYAALLTGKVKAISYDHQGRSKETFSVSVSQRSCRGISGKRRRVQYIRRWQGESSSVRYLTAASSWSDTDMSLVQSTLRPETRPDAS